MNELEQYVEQNFGPQWIDQVLASGRSLPPYFHPTRACLIDDNQSYLESVSLDLDEHWPHLCFTQPLTALDYLHAHAQQPLADRCLETTFSPGTSPGSVLRTDLIDQQISNADRFEQVSVLLIDFAMPLLNGLEFCDRVQLPYAQRAMLTGVADEGVAVEAFNAGQIDHYVKKPKLKTTADLTALIRRLQHLFFAAQAAPLEALVHSAAGFLSDPAVIQRIQAIMFEQQFVEYYLVDAPPGLLFLNAEGGLQRLLLADSREQAWQAEQAQASGAPPSLVQDIKRGRCLLFDWDKADEYADAASYPWLERVHPCEPINAVWNLAVVDDPPVDIDYDPERCSFGAYLRRYPGAAPSFT
ncbi:MAG: hypothetical protein AAF648_00490 [Pseudomonadota bacterium]